MMGDWQVGRILLMKAGDESGGKGLRELNGGKKAWFFAR